MRFLGPADGITNADYEHLLHFAAEIRKSGLMFVFASAPEDKQNMQIAASASANILDALSTITDHSPGGDAGPEAFVPKKVEQKTCRFGPPGRKENEKEALV